MLVDKGLIEIAKDFDLEIKEISVLLNEELLDNYIDDYFERPENYIEILEKDHNLNRYFG